MWEKIYSTTIGGSLVSGQAGAGNLTSAEGIDHRLPLSLGLLQCGEDLPDPLTIPVEDQREGVIPIPRCGIDAGNDTPLLDLDRFDDRGFHAHKLSSICHQNQQ